MNIKINHAWAWQMLVDLVAFIAFALWLQLAGAPDWALIILCYIATRTSYTNQSAGLSALQSTLKKRLPHTDDLEDIEPEEFQ